LPDAVVVAIRERLEMRRKLDYPSSRLDLLVTSEIERRTRLWSCRKEPETVEWLHKILVDGGVLYDIGANVGAYSLIAGRLVQKKGGAVYAFEPGYRTYANLVDNVMFNGLGDVIVPLPFAANSVTALVRFGYSETSAGSANHGGLMDGKVPSVANQSLVGCSLDDSVRLFALRPPTCMKIDVDGGEAAVLRGATNLLNGSVLNDILIEIDEQAETASDVHRCLETAGFKLVAEHRRGEGGAHNLIWSRR
jgi:FkbM family methyltransferase